MYVILDIESVVFLINAAKSLIFHSASFAMLGDIIIAEPNALIGFAGARVIKQTIGEDLPDGFQKSEFLLEKGFIDHIVSRNNMKESLSKLISFFYKGKMGE